jgi:hypothetical protein
MSRSDCIGKLSQINAMAKKQNAQYVIHTGDFGFYDDESLDRMNEKYGTLEMAADLEHSNMSSNTVPSYQEEWVAHSRDPIVMKLSNPQSRNTTNPFSLNSLSSSTIPPPSMSLSIPSGVHAKMFVCWRNFVLESTRWRISTL